MIEWRHLAWLCRCNVVIPAGWHLPSCRPDSAGSAFDPRIGSHRVSYPTMVLQTRKRSGVALIERNLAGCIALVLKGLAFRQPPDSKNATEWLAHRYGVRSQPRTDPGLQGKLVNQKYGRSLRHPNAGPSKLWDLQILGRVGSARHRYAFRSDPGSRLVPRERDRVLDRSAGSSRRLVVVLVDATRSLRSTPAATGTAGVLVEPVAATHVSVPRLGQFRRFCGIAELSVWLESLRHRRHETAFARLSDLHDRPPWRHRTLSAFGVAEGSEGFRLDRRRWTRGD